MTKGNPPRPPAFAGRHPLVEVMRALGAMFYDEPADRNNLLRGRIWVVDGRKLPGRPGKYHDDEGLDDDDLNA